MAVELLSLEWSRQGRRDTLLEGWDKGESLGCRRLDACRECCGS